MTNLPALVRSFLASTQNLGEPDKLHLLNITILTYTWKGDLVQRVCEIDTFTPPEVEGGDDVVKCRVPPGQGPRQKVVMYVGSHASTGTDGATTYIDYLPPTVTGMSLVTAALEPGPTEWPTDGLHPTSRQPYKMLVTGSNFGVFGRVTSLWRCEGASGAITNECHQRARQALDSAAETAAVLGQSMADGDVSGEASNYPEVSFIQLLTGCEYTDGTATCDPPQGDGKGLFPVVSLSLATGALVHDDAGAAAARRRLATGSATFAPPVVYSNTLGGPTNGGYTFTVIGRNFGRDTTPMSITIGAFPCTGVMHNHTVATCTVTEGEGASLAVSITVAGAFASMARTCNARRAATPLHTESRLEMSRPIANPRCLLFP